MLNFRNLRITQHAVVAMANRAVEIEEVAEILRDPQIVEPHGGKRRFVGNGLACVIAGPDEAPVLVTVLLREGGQWTDSDARGRG